MDASSSLTSTTGREPPASFFSRASQSPLARLTFGCVATAISAVSAPLAVPVALGILTAGYAYRHSKSIPYEVSLLPTIALHEYDAEGYPWYQPILEGKLTLGALPLKNYGHDEILPKKLGCKAILMVLKDWELKPSVFSEPMTPADWEKIGVKCYQIRAPDFQPVPSFDIENGVNFILECIEKGIHVYPHCKAGRGRSVTIVVCFLLLYGARYGLNFTDCQQAIDYVTGKRSVVNLNSAQKAAIQLFWEEHQKKKEQKKVGP